MTETMFEDLDEKEAAAELIARYLNKMSPVHHAEADSNLVRCWLHDVGINLSNVEHDWDFRMGEIIHSKDVEPNDPSAVVDGSSVYFNALADGVSDEPKGMTMPTFVHLRDGVKRRDPDELDDETRRLCEIANVPGLEG